jgi:hypothetical protein
MNAPVISILVFRLYLVIALDIVFSGNALPKKYALPEEYDTSNELNELCYYLDAQGIPFLLEDSGITLVILPEDFSSEISEKIYDNLYNHLFG